MFLKIFSIFKLIHIEEKADGNIKCNNLTLINLCLILVGPTNEKSLTEILLTIQVNEKKIALYFIIYTYLTYKFCFLVGKQFGSICSTLPISIIIL